MLAATCVSSLGSFYSMALTGLALPQIQRGLAIPEDELGSIFALLRFGTLLSLALAVSADRLGRRRLLIASVGASLGLGILSLLFAATGSHSVSITWLLVLTPISPIVLLFLPETAGRELEEIAPDQGA